MGSSHHVRREQEPNGIVSQGVFSVRDRSVAFSTSEPSPGRWIAVATVQMRAAGARHQPRRMLVGRGGSEAAALTDLRRRIAESAHPPLRTVVVAETEIASETSVQ